MNNSPQSQQPGGSDPRQQRDDPIVAALRLRLGSLFGKPSATDAELCQSIRSARPDEVIREVKEIFRAQIDGRAVRFANSLEELAAAIRQKLYGQSVANQSTSLAGASLPPREHVSQVVQPWPTLPACQEPLQSLRLSKGALLGPYMIISSLGGGAFSKVFKALDRSTGKMVVLKFGRECGGGSQVTRLISAGSEKSDQGISPDEQLAEMVDLGSRPHAVRTATRAEVAAIFDAEAKRLQELCYLGSPFVGLVEQRREGGAPVLVLDFVPGQDLRAVIRAGKGVDLKFFHEIARKLVAKGHHHGDLKPENIIINKDPKGGLVTLIDPAVFLHGGRGRILTPSYNPLCLHGQEADVFAIGVMMYECISGGRLPFEKTPWVHAGMQNTSETMKLELSLYLSYTSLKNSNNPQKVVDIIYRCLTAYEKYSLLDLRNELKQLIDRTGVS